MNFATLWPLLKPFAKELLDQVLIPEIMKLEDQIGNANVKLVVEALTTALEGVADSALAAP